MVFMKKLKIFIASFYEMRQERLELGALFTDMSTVEIDYVPVKWEYMDSPMNAPRKEDEYLRKLRKSEICIVMLWRKLGK